MGADLFITGEPRLSAYHEAQELGMNVAFAGHYATECVGVKAVLKRLTGWFDVETLFIDIPCDI
jgi:putative NIF3 family GTP cyclohydrolase 1 type 2